MAVTEPARAAEPTPATQTAPATEPATQAAATELATPRDPYEGYTLLGSPQVVEAFMLQVNDQVITTNEVLHAVRRELSAIPAGVTEKTFREHAEPIILEEVRRQVGLALLMDTLGKQLTDEEKEQIDHEWDAELRQMIAEAGGSRSRLDQSLRDQGTTLQEYTELRRRQMTAQLAMHKKFMPQVAVTRTQLWQYYQRHMDQFSSPKQVQMQILAVPTADFYPTGGGQPSAAELQRAGQAARERAEQALRRIQGGEDFGTVTKDLGSGFRAEQGGLWDFMPAESFREKAVEDAAFAMEAGQVSGVIQGESGWFIVKTVAVKPGTAVPFEEAQDRIAATLREQQYNDLTARYFDQLSQKATIQSAERFQDLAMDQSVRRFHRR
jgi:hypothetical protein